MANLPSGYIQVEYIESTGTQYIDTGISVPCNSEKIIVEFAPMEDTASNDNPLTGHAAPAWSWDANLAFVLNERLWTANMGYGLAVIERGTFYKFEYTSSYCMVNDANSQELSARTYTDGYNNTLCYASTKYGKHKIKSYKLYNGSTLVRDLVPCINASGEAGMYDLVGNRFYGNAGTGVFKYKLGDKGLYVGVPTFEKVSLPDGYTQVEYVESSGTQYIDTGFKPNQDTRIVTDATLLSVNSADGCFFGSAYPVQQSGFEAYVFNGTFYSVYNGAQKNGTATFAVDQRVSVDFNKNVCSIRRDGELIHTETHAYANFTSPTNLTLFLLPRQSKFYAIIRLHSCKVYDNGTLIRDYVPCTNASGEAGLYDLANGKFYTNTGTGTFVAGGTYKSIARKVTAMYVGVPEKYTVLDYIESSGTQYIDTGFKPNQDTRVVMDVGIALGGATGALFGGRETYATKDFSFWCVDSTSGLTNYGGTSNSISYSVDGRHLIDKDKNITKIDGETVHTASVTTFQSAYNLYLLAAYENTGVDGRNGKGKLYSCKIYDNGTLVRDYIPCANEQGECGMYDLVGEGFYGNAGTGTFMSSSVTSSNDEIETDSLARFVIKGYIGVAGIARPFWDANSGGGEHKASLVYHGAAPILSTGRNFLAATSIGDYALFGGGRATSYVSTVDAYNSSLSRSTPTAFNYGQQELAADSNSNYAVFGGGYGSRTMNSVVAYNASLSRNTPSTALSAKKSRLAATSIGGYVLFGGGTSNNATSGNNASVDAYNTSLTKTSVTQLSVARHWLAATTVGNYALFGGGLGNSVSAVVDAYNTSLTRSVPTVLSLARNQLAATNVGKYALFAGGYTSYAVWDVDAYDESLTRSTPDHLSMDRYSLAATSIGGFAIFGGGYSKNATDIVDAYDESLTRTVSTNLAVKRCELAAATIGGYALFGGGRADVPVAGVISNVDAYTIV